MSNREELTYYEYWLTKKSWRASWAIQLVFDYHKFKREWENDDNYSDIQQGFKNKLTAQMFDDRANGMFSSTSCTTEGYDESIQGWKEQELDIYGSEVKTKEFVEWVHSKGYQIPYEFKVFIGIEEKQGKITQKDAERIDKAVIQGIGRTLWDKEPEMKNEAMQEHRAIQIYGGGKGYPADTTLQRWLREVDPRKKKTGPKKKT